MQNSNESSQENTFATAVCCIDGRVQQPVADFGRQHFNVQYIDMITKPGAVAHMSDEISAYIKISMQAHQSCGIIISAHADCAANPFDDEIHKEKCRAAADLLRETWTEVDVIPVWVSLDNEIDLL